MIKIISEEQTGIKSGSGRNGKKVPAQSKNNNARSARAIALDRGKRAQRVFPNPPSESQKAKYDKHPNRYDIEGIDTPPRKGKKILTRADTEPKPERPKSKSKPRRNAREALTYSDREWKRVERLAETDPETASRLSMEMDAVEEMDWNEDMRSYLKDIDYDDYTEDKTWDQYRLKQKKAYLKRMADDQKTFWADAYNKKSKPKRSLFRRQKDAVPKRKDKTKA